MDVSALNGLSPVASTTSAVASNGPSGTTSAFGAQASSTAAAATEIYYSSPVFTVDTLTGALVQIWRDSKTGETVSQSPSRAALLYERSQSFDSASADQGRSGGVSLLA